MGKTRMAPQERLDRHLDKSGDCWEWTGCRERYDYGKIKVVIHGQTIYHAHRLAWVLANGRAIPDGLYVLHSCDNPPCCNPKHLSVGTQMDNVGRCPSPGMARLIATYNRNKARRKARASAP